MDEAKEKINTFKQNLIDCGIPVTRLDQMDFSKEGQISGSMSLPHNYIRNRILHNHATVFKGTTIETKMYHLRANEAELLSSNRTVSEEFL